MALPASRSCTRGGRCGRASCPAVVSRRRCPCPCERDRKSTRLNSSHDQISYAVFCLKKKKELFADLPALTRSQCEVASDPSGPYVRVEKQSHVTSIIFFVHWIRYGHGYAAGAILGGAAT